MYIKTSLCSNGEEFNIGSQIVITYIDSNEEITTECKLGGFERMCGTECIEIETAEGSGLIPFSDVIRVRKVGE